MENEELFNRCDSNPILSAKVWPYRANTVFNPAATLLHDGSTLLLCRVEDQSGFSHLCAARSLNGIDGWEIDPMPTFPPDVKNHPEELWGVEDPRITYVPELKQYMVIYTAYSYQGPVVALATTEDFRTFARIGGVTLPDNKDAVILPRRIKNMWAMIHRPTTYFGNHIWMSFSPDLIHWGRHTLIFESRNGGWWDGAQNRHGMSFDRDSARVDYDISRRAPNGKRQHLPARRGALRSRRPYAMYYTGEFVGVRSESGV